VAGAGWRASGFSTLVTRTAMLALSAFSLLGLFRLSRSAANLPVAWATTVGGGLSVCFTQGHWRRSTCRPPTYVLGAGRIYRRPSLEASALVLAGGARERDGDPGSAGVFGWELFAYLIRRTAETSSKETRWKEKLERILPPEGRRTRWFTLLFPIVRWLPGMPIIMRKRVSCWAILSSFATTSPPRSILCAFRLL